MAIGFVQTPTRFVNSPTGSASVVSGSFPSLPTIGNYVLALVNVGPWFTSAITSLAITDNQGHTYNVNFAYSPGSPTFTPLLAWAWVKVATSSGTFTVTADTSGGQDDTFIGLQLIELSGLAASSVVDLNMKVEDPASATYSTTFANIAIGTNDTADEILFAIIGPRNGGAFNAAAVPTGFTEIYRQLSSNARGIGWYKILSATGAQTISGVELFPQDGSPTFMAFSLRAAGPAGPTINTQPVASQVMPGATATFSVSATASAGSLSYQWQKSTDGGATFSNVSGGSDGTSASYTTAATALSDNGTKFRCVVTDTNGSVNSVDVWLHLFNQSIGRASKEFRFGLKMAGWLYQHNLDRSYRNVLFRQRITWGDPDSTEAISWNAWFFPAPTRMRVLNSGSQWVPASSKVWDGTSWVPKTNRIFNGVNWT